MAIILRSDVIEYLAQLDSHDYESLTSEARQTDDPRKLLADALGERHSGHPDEASLGDSAVPLNSDALTDALCARLGINADVIDGHDNLPDFL